MWLVLEVSCAVQHKALLAKHRLTDLDLHFQRQHCFEIQRQPLLQLGLRLEKLDDVVSAAGGGTCHAYI